MPRFAMRRPNRLSEVSCKRKNGSTAMRERYRGDNSGHPVERDSARAQLHLATRVAGLGHLCPVPYNDGSRPLSATRSTAPALLRKRTNMHCKFAVLAIVAALVLPARAEEPAQWAHAHNDELVTLYRHFHAHPELSFQEKETAARVAQEWKSAGYDVTTGIGGTGVVAILKNGPGPTLMLRTDLDALPVTENTNLVYASKVRVKQPDGTESGVMHACGHDIHITNLIGVGRYLAANKDRWSGTLMLIGQPAEEVGNGAKRCLPTACSRSFPSPIMPWPCTSTAACRRARWAIAPATPRPTSTASTSRCTAAAGTAPLPTRRSIRW